MSSYMENTRFLKSSEQNTQNITCSNNIKLAGFLKQSQNPLRLVELFSGAGGMGLGFLTANTKKNGFQIIQTSEINHIFLKSLVRNLKYFSQHSKVAFQNCYPSKLEPIDLTTAVGRDAVRQAINYFGGVDVLVGGPPCQGFSSANRRNSWNPDNPNNKLVDIFVECAIEFLPKVILLENVQGISWASRVGENGMKKFMLVDYLSMKLEKAGYLLFPKVLDAACYGVPQHRNRFFLLGIHRNVGYTKEDFYENEWGAFPEPTHGINNRPYVTVQEAIADLPVVDNGENSITQKYSEPTVTQLKLNHFLKQMREMSTEGEIEGHVVSKQAEYVIERYKCIPPGGNWKNIQYMMNNYADISRTHSNIYKRLQWEKPSITMSHYRKSMIIHPEQDRGLSLREATRLQSLPDWFTFCGTAGESKYGGSGIGYKQQQLANAVSFLLTVALAKHILEL